MNNDLFKDGDLLRGADKKFYVIKNGMRKHISRMTELVRDHIGKQVNKVSDEVLGLYPLINDENSFSRKDMEINGFSE